MAWRNGYNGEETWTAMIMKVLRKQKFKKRLSTQQIAKKIGAGDKITLNTLLRLEQAGHVSADRSTRANTWIRVHPPA